MVKKKVINRFGFTLIELVVVFGIISLISALTFASYNFFSAKKQLEEDVRKFISVLELAREKARGNEISKCPTGGVNLKEYFVEIIDSKNYEMYPICLDQNGTALTTPDSNKLSYSLKNSEFLSTLVFKFETNTGNLSSELGDQACVNIQIQGFAIDCKQVCVNSFGTINEKNCQ